MDPLVTIFFWKKLENINYWIITKDLNQDQYIDGVMDFLILFLNNNNMHLLQTRNADMLKVEIEDTEDAKSHLILRLENKNIYDDNGNIIYDSTKYPIQQFPDFPDTVNPYLWQINKDNAFAGIL